MSILELTDADFRKLAPYPSNDIPNMFKQLSIEYRIRLAEWESHAWCDSTCAHSPAVESRVIGEMGSILAEFAVGFLRPWAEAKLLAS